jgi:cell division protein FtsN
MKKTLMILMAFTFLFFSCKTAKKAATPAVAEEPAIEQIEEPVVKVEEPKLDDNTPIVMKTEEVTVAQNEDQSKEGYAFYVIIGSFSKPENAAKFKDQLIGKGFSPVLLNSETGYVRIAVDQSNSEGDARSSVMSIRQKFTEHNDVWLLKKK